MFLLCTSGWGLVPPPPPPPLQKTPPREIPPRAVQVLPRYLDPCDADIVAIGRAPNQQRHNTAHVIFRHADSKHACAILLPFSFPTLLWSLARRFPLALPSPPLFSVKT